MTKQNDKHTKEDEHIEEPEQDAVETETTELGELEQKVEEFENKYKRAIADYQNLQKRVQDEKYEWVRAANKELLLRLLPVLDTLVLANKHVQNEGLQVSINQFLDALKAEGVVKIKTVGEEFDPHIMDCVTVAEGEENKVLEEVRAGYTINDKVLRPAQVVVGKEKN